MTETKIEKTEGGETTKTEPKTETKTVNDGDGSSEQNKGGDAE